MESKFEEDVLISLKKIDSMLSNPRDILNSVAINIQKDIDRAFDSEQNPNDSSPWSDLTSSSWKKKKNIKKLQESFKGRNSIKVFIQGGEIFIKFESYMIYHITGTSKMPKRNFIPTPKNDQVIKIAEKSINRFIEKLPTKSFTQK
jgi:phage gpG-like protein